MNEQWAAGYVALADAFTVADGENTSILGIMNAAASPFRLLRRNRTRHISW